MYYVFTLFMGKTVRGKGYKTEQEALDAVSEWLRVCALNDFTMPSWYEFEKE
jgi:hypothetical protein